MKKKDHEKNVLNLSKALKTVDKYFQETFYRLTIYPE